MSRTLHRRPVDGLEPLPDHERRYWNRADHMEFKRRHVRRKHNQQLKDGLDLAPGWRANIDEE